MAKAGAKRLTVTSLEILIVVAILVCLGMLFTNSLSAFLAILYSPYSFAILVLIVVEYLILKGMDRSRFYLIEIERLRARRREQIKFFRQMEEQLVEILDSVNDQMKKQSQTERRQQLETIKSRVELLLAHLRETT